MGNKILFKNIEMFFLDQNQNRGNFSVFHTIIEICSSLEEEKVIED